MDQQQTGAFSQNLDSLFTNLEDFTKKEGVLGKPVTFGDKTLVPIVSVTLGYGSGNSAAKNQSGNGGSNQTSGMGMNAGMGAQGLGARVSADAVVVIDKDNVSLLPIDQKANMGQMMDKLPKMLMNMGQNKGQQGGQQGQGQGQNQGQSQGQSQDQGQQ